MKFNIPDGLSRAVSQKALVIQKHSPEILTVAGIIGFGATVVTACSATLKVDDILTEHKENIKKIDTVLESDEFKDEYSENDAVRDKAITYIQTGWKITKLYLPAISLGTLSIACLLSAHKIMSERNVALLAAYKASEEAFNNYRDKVKEEYGEEKDRQLYYGLETKKVDTIVTDENGKEKKKKVETTVSNGSAVSQYARYFDECNPNWTNDPDQNRWFLTRVQNQMNDRLRSVGHVFLNEVYEELGFKHSQAGAVVGWIYDDKDGMDNQIDFNIFDGESLAKREFVNGYESSILLDFNVDGVIYDLI